MVAEFSIVKFVLRSLHQRLLDAFSQKAMDVSIPAWYNEPTKPIRSNLTFVYIHGFNSGFVPESDKIVTLSKLGRVVGVNYDSFATYEEIIRSLMWQLYRFGHEDDLVFVGTSLGAFYAAELGRRLDRPSIIINPCTQPYTMLGFALHIPMENFVTGEINSFTMESKSSYHRRDISPQNDYLYKPLLLVDADDELIDSTKTFRDLSDFPKVAFSGGCHRFSHMEESLEPIQRYLSFHNA